ncbi:UPF0669 protein C6orf120 homolog [Stegodyphus dumicola]|uniref:UPF0669 protein C6orf120 homolog n=1 Tax=Stegodyphus dumicola TaxID=202533 RepID=UPI0015AAE5F5|nr:UPF0669 protein C6orf120 homolog [Stegodyphus dumicola]XP_035229604.1 UPF0669 protein C6orf120 homolog [Stegodyphus dumicola]XP_035229605.1 UPF0669 protein C6orf120 homolog [Stegodyphus dumicola]
MMKAGDKFISLFLIMWAPLCLGADHFQETLLGTVGGGNYSYYWLPQPGTVVLYLRTLEGDADLYVSSKNLKPTFDIENHELQSTTCGIEQIKVPAGYGRPLSIAVYGHPSHEISLYELKIDVFDAVEDVYPDLNPRETKKTQSNKPPSSSSLPVKDEPEYEERSVFWTLFLHVLQVLLDLLVD